MRQLTPPQALQGASYDVSQPSRGLQRVAFRPGYEGMHFRFDLDGLVPDNIPDRSLDLTLLPTRPIGELALDHLISVEFMSRDGSTSGEVEANPSDPEFIEITTKRYLEAITHKMIRGARKRIISGATSEPADSAEDFIYSRFNARLPVRRLPTIQKQLSDKTRSACFDYYEDCDEDKPPRQMEEHAGLNQLMETLRLLSTAFDENDLKDEAEIAKNLSDTMGFIGGPELEEATSGIASYWKSWLAAHPDAKLFILSDVSSLPRYDGQLRKSDDFLLEQILRQFSPEELQDYASRIIVGLPEKIPPDQNQDKVVILDDWTISGKQVRDQYTRYYAENKDFRKIADAGKVELQLLASSEDRLLDGFQVKFDPNHTKSIPVRAYFLLTAAPDSSLYEHEAHVSGLHSSANYDFEDTIKALIKRYAEIFGDELRPRIPALCTIKRKYRYKEPKFKKQGPLSTYDTLSFTEDSYD